MFCFPCGERGHCGLGLTAGLMLASVVHADILNVPADYATIQAAIDAASSGDEVVVAPGTYSGFTVGGQTITIRSSGGRDMTTLDGGGAGGICSLGTGSEATIEGFTFTNGNSAGGSALQINVADGTIQNCTFINNTGTAIEGFAKNVTITGCSFIANSGDFGAAIVMFTSLGNAYTVSNCVFQNNTASDLGGAIYAATGPHSIVDCTFEGNSAAVGGAVVITQFQQTLVGCEFINNTATDGDGGAVSCIDGSIDNCVFMSNSAPNGSGGAVRLEGIAMMTGCTLTGNSAASGGGLSARFGFATVDQCTMTKNEAAGDGGGIWCDNATLTSCELSNNTAAGNGGGMFLIESEATECPLVGNTAGGSGGAVHAESEGSELHSCDMSLNAAGTTGGGLYVRNLATVLMTDSTICMNTPDQVDFVGGFIATNVSGCDLACPKTDPVGACCLPQGNCLPLTAATCLAVGGTYQGDDTSCDDAPCVQPCPADLNGDDLINVLDLLQVLSAWGVCP